MKLKFLISILFIVNGYSINAQVSFELPLYFEDGQGNKDTVTIGARIDGDWYENQGFQFGEYPDISLIDSVFDVRLRKRFSQELTKIAIVPSNNDCFTASPDMPFFNIYAKYPPITVSYDYSIIEQNFCDDIFTFFWYDNRILWQDGFSIYYPPVINCLENTNATMLNYNELVTNNLAYDIYLPSENGDTVKLLLTQMISISNNNQSIPWWETCQVALNNDVTLPSEIHLTSAGSLLHIKSDYILQNINIYNLNGSLVTASNKPSNFIEIGALANGIYIIKLISNKGTLSSKFIKG